jgi:hypothetical protein
VERGAVRGTRHAAGAGVRALPLATVVLTLALAAPPGRAGTPPDGDAGTLRGSGLPTLGAWLDDPGRAGYQPLAWLTSDWPPLWAGHVLGGLALDDAVRGAPASPWPGTLADGRPLAWFDSVTVEPLPRAGMDGALARARALRATTERRRTRAMWTYTTGDHDVDEVSLIAERGDDDRGVRAEVMSGKRGPMGTLGAVGRHSWGVSSHTVRGAHRFEAAFAQRGWSDGFSLEGIHEAGEGESGRLSWAWGGKGRRLAASWTRAWDERASSGDFIAFSRRDAARERTSLTGGLSAGGTALEGTLAYTRSRVRRAEAFDVRDDAAWAELRATRPAGEGTLEATLAGGRHGAVGGTQLVPGALYRFEAVGVRGAASIARVVTPAWSDLEAGEAPFLQRTWAGGLDVRAGEGTVHARCSFLGGVTHDRALVAGEPLSEFWLREGMWREHGRAAFALGQVALDWRTRRAGAGVEGFVLRERDAALASEPPHGFRAHAALRLAPFGGDLQTEARLEAEGLGPRVVDGATSVRVPGYTALGATLALTISDATLCIRVRNLGDTPRPLAWIDPVTGRPALGPGREMRFSFTWALMD